MSRCRTQRISNGLPSRTWRRPSPRFAKSCTWTDHMATKVFMEALSPTMEEGRIAKWNKKEGDVVKSGESLAEVETDKAIMELVARGDGVLRKILVGEGESKPVGSLVGVIAAADENIDALIAGAAGAGAAPAAAAKPAEQAAAGQQAAPQA